MLRDLLEYFQYFHTYDPGGEAQSINIMRKRIIRRIWDSRCCGLVFGSLLGLLVAIMTYIWMVTFESNKSPFYNVIFSFVVLFLLGYYSMTREIGMMHDLRDKYIAKGLESTRKYYEENNLES